MGSRKAKRNELVYSPFSIFSDDGLTPLSGQAGGCTYNLTLNNANAPEAVTIAEIGSTGHYHASVTPLSLGSYDLEITCPDNRVLGETLSVEAGDLDDILSDTNAISGVVNTILIDTNEIQEKLPTNYIMGASNQVDNNHSIQWVPQIPISIDLANTVAYRVALHIIDGMGIAPTTAQITAGTIYIERKAKGGTSWVVIVNNASANKADGLVYYDEVFDSGTGYVEGDSIRIRFLNQKVTINGVDYEAVRSGGANSYFTYIREIGVKETYAKLPTNYIMGSSDVDNHDTDIDAILVDTGTSLPNQISAISGVVGLIDTGVDAIEAKLPTNYIMGSSDVNDHDTDIDSILVDTGTSLPNQISAISGVINTISVDTNEIQEKLPTNYIMGSSDVNDHDTDIDAILVDTGTSLPNQISAISGVVDLINTGVDIIEEKLPTNYIMGSSVQTDKDDEIDSIKTTTEYTSGVVGTLANDETNVIAEIQASESRVSGVIISSESNIRGADDDDLKTLSDQLDTITNQVKTPVVEYSS
jgi:hypothetical protein